MMLLGGIDKVLISQAPHHNLGRGDRTSPIKEEAPGTWRSTLSAA
jgi:hypothetical protein